MATLARHSGSRAVLLGGGGLLLGALVGCGASGSAPPADAPHAPVSGSASAAGTAATAPEAPFEPTAEERATCGTTKPKPVDDFACLVAARARAAKGDAKGAEALLELGCKEGDLDACLELHAAALKAQDDARATALLGKVGAACDALGDASKRLAACLRDRSTEVLRIEGYPASLPYALALRLRAELGPALLAIRGTATAGCTEALTSKRAPLLGGTPLASDPRILDAVIACKAKAFDPDALGSLREGQIMSDTLEPRTLRDGFFWEDRKTLRLDAPSGDTKIGVWCPSSLVDDDRAADVWMTAPSPNGPVMVVATVALDAPCLDAAALPGEQQARKTVETAYAKEKAAIESALDKLAARCDEDPAGFDPKQSPLAGETIGSTAAILAFEAKCVFGYGGFAFRGKAIQHPKEMTTTTFVVQAGGHAVRVQSIKEQPDRFELSFRRRFAELTVVVKRPG
ncbi:MAG: hypothetical protein IT373_17450 [Polyangiaceae bacterium]|nr:hypothetical protein [Polyangiaceae bacterium]